MRSLLAMDIAVCLLVVNGRLYFSAVSISTFSVKRRSVSPKMPQAIKYTKAGLGVGCPSWKLQWQVHATTTYYLMLPRQSDPWREIQASTCTGLFFVHGEHTKPLFCHWTIPTKFLVPLDLHRETVHILIGCMKFCGHKTVATKLHILEIFISVGVPDGYRKFMKSLNFCCSVFSASLVRGCHWPHRWCSCDVHPLNFILVHRSIMLQAVLQRGYLQVS